MNKELIDPATARATELFMQRIEIQYDMAGAMLFGSRASSLSDFGIVGCKSTAPAPFLPASCPMEQPCGGESGKKRTRRGLFSLSTTKVRQAARRTHRADSDPDVAFLLRGEHQRFLSTKLAMSDVAFDVMLETGINISPLPVWLDEWSHPETNSNPDLLRNIANEGIRL